MSGDAMKATFRMLAAAWLALATLAAPMAGQGRGPDGRGKQHDATVGPPVTGSDIAGTRPFLPGEISPETAARLAEANLCVSQHLEARTLTDVTTGELLPRTAQEAVIRVILNEEPPEDLAAVLAAGGPAAPARALADALVGLTNDRRNGQLADAIGHFNDLVESRTEEFLADPSQEIIVVHAILTMLSLEAQCQGLEKVALCVITQELMPAYVDAFLHPITGDTLVTGRPIGEIHDRDQPQYAARHDWFLEDRPVTVQHKEFLKFGESRQVTPDDVRRVGKYRDVPLFTGIDAPAPFSEILVPVGPGCDFQPYAPRTRVERPIRVCVVTPEGLLTTVEASYRPVTGDTLIAGRPFHEVHHPGQPQYASGHDWFMEDRPLSHEKQEYVKFGVHRVIINGSLRHVGDHDGVPIFVERGSTAPHAEILLPVGPGCEFQLYLAREAIRIRG